MIRIVILDRGFVCVGTLEPHPDFAFHWLFTGRTIRRWGTTEGLAQLANGPLPNTALDAPETSDIPWRAVLKTLHVSEEAWLPHLSATRQDSAGGRRARP